MPRQPSTHRLRRGGADLGFTYSLLFRSAAVATNFAHSWSTMFLAHSVWITPGFPSASVKFKASLYIGSRMSQVNRLSRISVDTGKISFQPWMTEPIGMYWWQETHLALWKSVSLQILPHLQTVCACSFTSISPNRNNLESNSEFYLLGYRIKLQRETLDNNQL